MAPTKISFRKMHGAGNDFVVLDARVTELALDATAIAAICDRRTGIGCDQLIVLQPARDGADVVMRIYNPDGGEAAACGNATRCVALVLGRETSRDHFVIATRFGHLAAELLPDGLVRVDMGAPLLGWRDIPLAWEADTLHLPLPGDPAAASMGNPHATFFVDDLETIDPAALGPGLERDPLFPERANIGFAQIEARDRIFLRVWERGAGFTRACGSGACAALVNAHRRGFAGRQAIVRMDGGELVIAWRESDGHVLMTGPAVLSFDGSACVSKVHPVAGFSSLFA